MSLTNSKSEALGWAHHLTYVIITYRNSDICCLSQASWNPWIYGTIHSYNLSFCRINLEVLTSIQEFSNIPKHTTEPEPRNSSGSFRGCLESDMLQPTSQHPTPPPTAKTPPVVAAPVSVALRQCAAVHGTSATRHRSSNSTQGMPKKTAKNRKKECIGYICI